MAAEFAAFFGLSGRPTLAELVELYERAGIGKVSPANLPADLRGIHYPLPGAGRAVHYQEGQWEASSEHTGLHEGYEIVYETMWLRCHGEQLVRKACPEADRFAAAVLMPPETFAAYALASGLHVAALKNVFRCAYSSVTIRLGEVMDRQPLLAVLYERCGGGALRSGRCPPGWGSAGEGGEADGGHRAAPLSSCERLAGGSPRKGKPLPAGSVPEREARSGEREYAEGADWPWRQPPSCGGPDWRR